MAKSFNDLFLEAASELVTTKSRYVKSKILPPWLDDEVQQNKSLRDQLKRSELWSAIILVAQYRNLNR